MPTQRKYAHEEEGVPMKRSYHAAKNAPRTGCNFAPTTNPQPEPFQPTAGPPMQRNGTPNVTSPYNVVPNNVAPKCGVSGKCGVTTQCGATQCGAKMWRHGQMWRHQTMWRQTMRRQNVASRANVASPNNVAPNNVAPKCGVTKQSGAKQCGAKMWRHRQRGGVTTQCGAKQCGATMWRHRTMRRHHTMWRQRMWRHMSGKCVFIMCLQRQVEKCVLFCQHRDL